MYVRYKKNIQENDLPRKRVRKASKIAGSGGQYLEIRCPERGRKQQLVVLQARYSYHLEIRCPERGRKLDFYHIAFSSFIQIEFGNKMPREGTETNVLQSETEIIYHVFGNKMPREGTETFITSYFLTRTLLTIWK